MTDETEMQRRQKAVEKVAEMVRTVYAGQPSIKTFNPKRLSASSLVAKTAEAYAKELIEANEILENGGTIPMGGSYWGFWGDMASTRVLEGPEVDVDGAEFDVTIDIGDGFIIGAHPDGAKTVEVDGKRYVVLIEQKNYDNVTTKKRVVALRQGALYAAMMRAECLRTGSKVFDIDPNYLRATKPIGVTIEMPIAGVVRSICSPRPPGEAYPVAFSDEDLDAWLANRIEKAQHVKAAVVARDLDYARKWDSEHADEFGGPENTPTGAEAKQIIAEYKQITAAIKDLEERKEEMRPHLMRLAREAGGAFDLDGYVAKIQTAQNPPRFDKTAMERDGVLKKYMVPGGQQTRLIVTTPGAKE